MTIKQLGTSSNISQGGVAMRYRKNSRIEIIPGPIVLPYIGHMGTNTGIPGYQTWVYRNEVWVLRMSRYSILGSRIPV